MATQMMSSLKLRTFEPEGYDCPYCGTRNEKRFIREGRWIMCNGCNQIFDVAKKLKRPYGAQDYTEKAISCHNCSQLIYGWFKIIDGYRLCSICAPKPKRIVTKSTKRSSKRKHNKIPQKKKKAVPKNVE
jgi:ssDNA-binding Zn-finger/Zn-ribbon topoisomerase 1